MNRRINILIWLTLGFTLGVLCFMPRCSHAATYEQEKEQTGPTYEERGVEYNQEAEGYQDRQEIDQPPDGWYQDPRDFPIPESWPNWVVKNFDSLMGEELPESYANLHKWAKDPLKANTKWIDVKADRINNAIEITSPKGAYFTFFRADPPDVTLEQDFNGNAVLYNADDSIQYRIDAYSESGYLGAFVTSKTGRVISMGDLGWITDPIWGRTPETFNRYVRGGDVFVLTGVEPEYIMVDNPTWRFVAVLSPTIYKHRLGSFGYIGDEQDKFWIDIIGYGDIREDQWFFQDCQLGKKNRSIATCSGVYQESGNIDAYAWRILYDSKFNELFQWFSEWEYPPFPACGWTWSDPHAVSVVEKNDGQGYVYCGFATAKLTESEGGAHPSSCVLTVPIQFDWHTVLGKLDTDLSYGGVWGNGNNWDDDFVANGDDNIFLHKIIVDENGDYVSLSNAEWNAGTGLIDSSDTVIFNHEGTPGANEGDRNWKATLAAYLLYDIVDVGPYYLAVGRYETNNCACVCRINKTDGSILATIEYDAEYFYSVNISRENNGVIIAGYALNGAVKTGCLVKAGYSGAEEWVKTFTENLLEDTVLVDAKETIDHGYLALGYQLDTTDNRRWEYSVKTNRYGQSCSQGEPCK